MLIQDAAKPATAIDGEPALKIELLAGVLVHLDTRETTLIQARRLCRLYALTYATATTMAQLAYGVAR
ncbi:hypothetical protein ACVWWG_007479 [Bradyrhizobium sp. LB7.2]